MLAENEFLETRQLQFQALELQPELLALFLPALPAVMRGDRTLDLHADREVTRNRGRGEAVGIRAQRNGGPGDKHGAKLEGANGGARREFALDAFPRELCSLRFSPHQPSMRDDYIKEALKTISDPNVLINVVSRRVKQLRRGNRPLVESLEKLSPEDTALREVIEGKISHELAA